MLLANKVYYLNDVTKKHAYNLSNCTESRKGPKKSQEHIFKKKSSNNFKHKLALQQEMCSYKQVELIIKML